MTVAAVIVMVMVRIVAVAVAVAVVPSAPLVLGRSHRITSEKFITQCASSIPNPGLMAHPD